MPFLTICSSSQYTRSLANNRFSLFLYANMHKSMCIYLFILYKTFETKNFYSVPQNVELFMNYEIFQSLNRCGQPLWGTFLRTFLWILSSMVITATYIHLLIKGLPAIVPSQVTETKHYCNSKHWGLSWDFLSLPQNGVWSTLEVVQYSSVLTQFIIIWSSLHQLAEVPHEDIQQVKEKI